jgi:hypothetical protein
MIATVLGYTLTMIFLLIAAFMSLGVYVEGKRNRPVIFFLACVGAIVFGLLSLVTAVITGI